MPAAYRRLCFYAIFLVSGGTGLIYESIWARYLKLLLGHAAYAQTLVLAIFMGGMSLGSWWVANRSGAIRQPLRIYAAVEATLGVAGLAFDHVFRAVQAFALDSLVPRLGNAYLIDVVLWALGALLILPQSVLLGATFPMISAGLIRSDPSRSGRALGSLYFANSLGAAIGVLLCGFYLVPAVGLPGAILTAGLTNLAIAAAARGLASGWIPAFTATAGSGDRSIAESASKILLLAAFITGTASFLYEIGWLRMLSLVLGSATHSFELMLAAFILGLALGGWLIRGRIDRQLQPWHWLAWILIAMGTAAFASIPIYNQSFDWMAAILHAVQRTDAGYHLYNLLSQMLCLAVMLPVTVLAGTTLPLITATLMRTTHGESGIGRVYAVNTLGAIAGVFLGVHILMPYFGLRAVILCGAAAELLLGLGLALRVKAFTGAMPVVAATVSLALALGIAAWVPFDRSATASGVFRSGEAHLDNQIVYHRDGKTATVDVALSRDGVMSIATNGKSDGALAIWGSPTADDLTMILLGALPQLEVPKASHVAVIGLGTGRSTHALLLNPRLASVDTIEIEPAMAEGARLFKDASSRAFDDPRSHIYFEDAKTFFARNQQRYDCIVSEPSNPWVSGVSSLFSEEFYGRIKRYLAPGGVLVQWIQLYEIDLPAVATVMNAVANQFDDYAIYAADDGDILLVASPHGPVPEPSASAFSFTAVSAVLDSVDLTTLADIQARKIGTKHDLAPLFAEAARARNSDYFPVLDQLVDKARFEQASALPLLELRRVRVQLESPGVPAPPLSMPRHRALFYSEGALQAQAQILEQDLTAEGIGNGLAPALHEGAAAHLESDILGSFAALNSLDQFCRMPAMASSWSPGIREFSINYLPYLSRNAVQHISGMLRSSSCYAELPNRVRQWINLFEAVGEQNWADVEQIGLAMLPAAEDEAARDYLEQEVLIADLKSQGRGAATMRVAQFGHMDPESLALRYLKALALAGS